MSEKTVCDPAGATAETDKGASKSEPELSMKKLSISEDAKGVKGSVSEPSVGAKTAKEKASPKRRLKGKNNASVPDPAALKIAESFGIDYLDQCPAGMIPPTVKKEIVYAGDFNTATPPPYPGGTRLRVHYKTTLCTYENTVLDDSRNHPKPMEFIMGKKFKLKIWELALNTMFVGEISKYMVPKDMCTFYPVISRVLRNTYLPKDQARPVTTSSCCANALTGTGYPDLDKLLKEPQNLAFTFELLEVALPGQYEMESWFMNDEEKQASYPKLRTEGNELYNKKMYEEASRKYMEALSITESLLNKEVPGGEESIKLKEQKIPLLLNYAMCKQQTKEYYEAIKFNDLALEIEPNNVKGTYRNGQCYVKTGQWELARRDLERARVLDPSLAKAVQTQLAECTAAENNHKATEAAKYRRMFEN